MEFYIYIFLMSIVIILLFKIFRLSTYSPKKIKVITIITIIAVALRYVTLLILFLVHNIKYLYLLKPLFFMNLIAVPLISLTVLYIFMRSDSMNFSYVFIVAVVLMILYSVAMYKCPCLLQNYNNCGYIMSFAQDNYVYWTYIVLNTIILFSTIMLMSRKNINKLGMILIIIASIVTITECIIRIAGIILLLGSVIGDLLWVITLAYALHKVRKKA